MKKITVIIILFANINLFAQNDFNATKTPVYSIRLTTINDNMLKGLLMEIKDSSLVIYPGKRKEWKNNIHYKPVEFNHTNIQQVGLKRKNGTWRGMLIGGGIGTAIFACTFLFPGPEEKNHAAAFTFFAVPVGLVSGAIVGSTGRKKFHFGGSGQFTEFKKGIQ